MKKIFLLTFTFLTSSFAYSSVLDHPNKGCPNNSECEKEYGLLREQFKSSLATFNSRKKFFNLHGAPFRLFTKKETTTKLKKSLAWWDSKCEGHRKEKKIVDAEYFTKELNKSLELHGHVIKVIKDQKLIASFQVPHNASVLQINDQGLFFETYEEDISLRYQINSKGVVSPIEKTITRQPSSITPCQKNDLLHFKGLAQQQIYSFIECREYSNGPKIIQALSCI